MILNSIDVKKDRRLSVKTCYSGIYNWYTANIHYLRLYSSGSDYTRLYSDLEIKEINSSIFPKDDPYFDRALEMVKALPKPEQVTPAELSVVAEHIVSGNLEWAYHQADTTNIHFTQLEKVTPDTYEKELGHVFKMAEYAFILRDKVPFASKEDIKGSSIEKFFRERG